MLEIKVRRENYLTIQGFMVTDLKLKGNELLIYAIIYGFSQAENQAFNGSLQYFTDWTNSTKQGVIKSIKSLEEKGLITKTENFIRGVKIVEYYATPLNKVYPHSTEFNGIKQSLPNNIYNIYNTRVITEDKIEVDNKDISNYDIYAYIIDYLNKQSGSSYRASTPKTQTLIKARLAEGFKVDDFKKVIDNKVASWKGTEWEKFLRPETLFGTKFESYLNERQVVKKTEQQQGGMLDMMQSLYEAFKAEENDD